MVNLPSFLPILLPTLSSAGCATTFPERQNEKKATELRWILIDYDDQVDEKRGNKNHRGLVPIFVPDPGTGLPPMLVPGPSPGGPDGPADNPSVFWSGVSSKMNCESTPVSSTDVIDGLYLCVYEDPPFLDYNTGFACWCQDSSFDEPTRENCPLCTILWFSSSSSPQACRSASLIPTETGPSDGTFQLQFDCSNVFQSFNDDLFDSCVGRDRDGHCFPENAVPNPSNPVTTGIVSELSCSVNPYADTMDPPFGGKYECHSPRSSRSPGSSIPYPYTGGYVGLLCDGPTYAEGTCECYVSTTFLPVFGKTLCQECTVLPASTDTTYTIAFDCSNQFSTGDCTGVNEDGNCFSATSDSSSATAVTTAGTTFTPTVSPSSRPSDAPTLISSTQPTIQSTGTPTMLPSTKPTVQSTGSPTTLPSTQSTVQPTGSPTTLPSTQPTVQATGSPTTLPSTQPTVQPTSTSSAFPTTQQTLETIDETSTDVASAVDSDKSITGNAPPETAADAESGKSSNFSAGIIILSLLLGWVAVFHL